MKKSLPEIISELSELDAVEVFPKIDVPIDIFDFYSDMEILTSRYGLREDMKAATHIADWEKARTQGESVFASNKHHRYSVAFCSELSAQRFIEQLNHDPKAMYTASVPETPIGLVAFQPVKRIS